MAGILLTASPAAITMTSASGPITALQIVAASNHRAILNFAEVSMNGITAADPPVLFDVCIETTAGTMSSLTLIHKNALDTETIQTTAQHTATVEPTATNILWRGYYHEMTGGVIPLQKIVIPGGTKLGIRYTSGTLTATTKLAISAEIEE